MPHDSILQAKLNSDIDAAFHTSGEESGGKVGHKGRVQFEYLKCKPKIIGEIKSGIKAEYSAADDKPARSRAHAKT